MEGLERQTGWKQLIRKGRTEIFFLKLLYWQPVVTYIKGLLHSNKHKFSMAHTLGHRTPYQRRKHWRSHQTGIERPCGYGRWCMSGHPRHKPPPPLCHHPKYTSTCTYITKHHVKSGVCWFGHLTVTVLKKLALMALITCCYASLLTVTSSFCRAKSWWSTCTDHRSCSELSISFKVPESIQQTWQLWKTLSMAWQCCTFGPQIWDWEFRDEVILSPKIHTEFSLCSFIFFKWIPKHV